MICSAALHVPRTFLVVLLALSLMSFTACSSTVTSGGQVVENKALATAARSIHIAEMAAVTVTDGLTAGFRAGLLKADVLDHYQATVAPRIAAALATAKVAIKTANAAPGKTPIAIVLTAVLELQDEVNDLQGFWVEHGLIIPGKARP